MNYPLHKVLLKRTADIVTGFSNLTKDEKAREAI